MPNTRKDSVGNERDLSAFLRCGASMVAMVAFAAATPVFAQTGSASGDGTAGQTAAGEAAEAGDQGSVSSTTGVADAGEAGDDAIIITGIRQSLANAQNIKRNADTVVDAITAQDIGALPDRSVTEALQRVPGVAMNRFAGSNDPDHFSVEGSGVVVRGLTFVRSEFNGRDTFHTGVYGQAINFADVPAELLGSVEVYKNVTAEMIEGGLAGTVNLNTRLPFDNRGFHVGFNVEAGYGDFRKKWTPTASLLLSNTWDTGIGRIGLLGSVSYSQVKSRADGMQVSNFQTRDDNLAAQAFSTNWRCRNGLPTDSTDNVGFPPPAPSPGGAGALQACQGTPTAGANGQADLMDIAYAPIGANFRTQHYNRERTGTAVAAQWESLDRRALLTMQYLRTEASQKWGEWTFEAGGDLSEYNTYPAGCRPNDRGPRLIRAEDYDSGSGEPPPTGSVGGGDPTTRAECPIGQFANYQYDENGVFERGYITLPGTGWRSGDSGGSWRTPIGGMQHTTNRRQVDDENVVADYGANFKFNPTDRLQFNFDAQHVKAEHRNLDMGIHGSLFADTELDLTGGTPNAIVHKPLWLAATWAGGQAPEGGPCNVGTVNVGGTTINRANGMCTPNARLNSQTDEQYFADPANSFWRSAMDHIEQSEGKQWTFRGDVAYSLEEDIPFLKRVKFGARWADRDQTVRYTTYNWGSVSEVWTGAGAIWMDEIGGDQIERFEFNNFFRGDTTAPPGAWYYAGNLIEGYDAVSQFAAETAAEWDRRRNATGSWVPLAARPGVIAGTPFLPADIQLVSQETKNAYAMLSFGSDDPIFGNVTLDGNIGVRYVHDTVESVGAISIPTQVDLGVSDPFAVRCAPVPPPPNPPPGAPTDPRSPGGVCTLGPEGYAQVQQFATGGQIDSTAVNKYDYFLPSLNLKFGLTEDLILRLAGSRVLTRPSMADIRNFLTIGLDGPAFSATAGNPFLKPAVADQFDLSLEWYFARVGSLTLNGFYKEVSNFFFQELVERDITNNGVTATTVVRGPANFNGKGKIKGFEIAYQQTYDFLPGFLSGFGLNANYTYIKSKGLPNSMLNGGVAVNEPPTGLSGNLPLEQLSKHNVNVAAFYEKGPISLRAAYNWRSKFLLTATDVIFPYFPIFNDEAGYLDASAFFNVTPQLKIGVQGSNLLNTVTKTLQQFSPEGLIGPRSYFMNDRRFSLIVRGNF
jgi:TonB-dependent receptor